MEKLLQYEFSLKFRRVDLRKNNEIKHLICGILDVISLLFHDNRINYSYKLPDSLESSFDDIFKSDHQIINVNSCVYKQTNVLIQGLRFFKSFIFYHK